MVPQEGWIARLTGFGCELVDALVPQVCPLCRAARHSCGCEEIALLADSGTAASVGDRVDRVVRSDENERGGRSARDARVALCEWAERDPRSVDRERDGHVERDRRNDRSGRCGVCAARVSLPLHGRPCRACRESRPAYERCIALADYHSRELREWILRFKHGGRRDLGDVLGRRLARAILASDPDSFGAAWWSTAVVVPIPLHFLRRVERGYDQATLLARAVADELGCGLTRALVRTRATPPQGGLSAGARRENVRGAFDLAPRARRAVRERAVVLVDDVVASGGTAREAAHILRSAGASSVWLAVVGRA